MNRIKKYSIGLFLIVLLFVFSTVFIFGEGSLKKISDQKFKVLSSNKCQVLLYNSLQESELAVINQNDTVYNEDGVILGDRLEAKTDKEKRNMVHTGFQIKAIKTDNSLIDIVNIEIPVSYDTLDGTRTDSVKIADINNRKVVLQNDPDLCPYNFVGSYDASFGIIWTEKGLWKVSAKDNSVKKISTQYKTIDYKEINSGDSAVIYWNNDPKISEDGSNIVYTSNRNSFIDGGNSIWIYNNINEEEKNIIVGAKGVYYSVIGWCDNNSFIYEKSTNGKAQYYISNTFGEEKEIQLEGSSPDIISIKDGLIAYMPVQMLQNEIIVSSVNTNDATLTAIARVKIDGSLRLPCAGFSPDLTRFAFLYVPTDNNFTQQACVLNLANSTTETVKTKNFVDKKVMKNITGMEWGNASQLIILAGDENNVSTWSYNVEE